LTFFPVLLYFPGYFYLITKNNTAGGTASFAETAKKTGKMLQ